MSEILKEILAIPMYIIMLMVVVGLTTGTMPKNTEELRNGVVGTGDWFIGKVNVGSRYLYQNIDAMLKKR